MDDMETVDPRMRVDVLAYRGAQKLVEHIEQQSGLVGLWDNLKPHINSFVAQGLSGIEIPTEAKVLLGIMQANMKGKNE